MEWRGKASKYEIFNTDNMVPKSKSSKYKILSLVALALLGSKIFALPEDNLAFP